MRQKEGDSVIGSGKTIVVDVGAANAIAGIPGRGVVERKPTATMLQAHTTHILAIGDEAWKALERVPGNIVAERVLKNGINGCDPYLLSGVLDFLLAKAFNQNFFLCHPGVLFSVPSCATAYERRVLADAVRVRNLGGPTERRINRRVEFVDETLAHAVGMGLWRRKGCSAALVVGARCCQAAVFFDGELALSRCLHSRTPLLGAAGDALDAAVGEFFERECGLVVGTEYAERVKRSVGVSAATAGDVVPPPGCRLSAAQVAEGARAAMYAPIERLAAMFGELLENAAREFGDAALSEIASGGVMLSGGGAQLRGLDAMLGDKFKMEFALAERPLDSAAEGMLEMVAAGRIPTLPMEGGLK